MLTPKSTTLGVFGVWSKKIKALDSGENFEDLIKSLFSNNERGFILDPNDMSTMFQDSERTLPVTMVNQPVGFILDKSGRGNHAYQRSSSSRPMLRQNPLTGFKYLEFDGIDDFLETDAVSIPRPFSLMTGVVNTKFIGGAQAILSAATTGYVYSSYRVAENELLFATQQLTANPQLQVMRSNQDVLFINNTNIDNEIYLKTNTTQNSSKILVSNDPYVANSKKYIGTYSSALAAYAGMRLYGIFINSRSLTAKEEASLRRFYNKRIGI